VRVDDLVDVLPIDLRVRDCVRIDDDARTLVAAVQAAGLVDADLALTAEAKLFDASLRVLLHLGRVMTAAAGGTFLALVQTEKDVMLVVTHGVDA
jgi:hypothetical protein